MMSDKDAAEHHKMLEKLTKKQELFKTIHLGQKVLHFTTPQPIVDEINKIYDKNLKDLTKHNKHLAGKIEDEHKVDEHLPENIKMYFEQCFRMYTVECKVTKTINLRQAWINEMKANEYNPFHYHMGKKGHECGLSSVMMLKKPNTYGKEYSREHVPTNGTLELIAGSGVLSYNQLRINMNVGDFFVFPYDMMHGVYPFNGTIDTRRTLSYNCDLGNDLENLFEKI
jgi:hypothetical protein|tara:strand:+ start:412 stop:1089 length:678 start_codon:yes stop_codon:yes gene_type:complete